jgi:hypothetical protein
MVYFSPIYTIEAMDWNTGRSLYHVELSSLLVANSLYAATEIGDQNDVIMGTLSGILHVSAVKPSVVDSDMAAAPYNAVLTALDQMKLSPKWQLLDELAQLNEQGRKPSVELRNKLGLRIF